MAGIEVKNLVGGRKTYYIRLSEGEDLQRRRIAFGRITRRQAETAKTNVEHLVAARNTGSVIGVSTQDWLAGLRPSIRLKLEDLGLCRESEQTAQVSLADWLDSYIAGRTDVKPNTIRNMKAACNDLLSFCDSGMKKLGDFTAYDAEEFHRHLHRRGLSKGTVGRRCKRLKQFFAAAVRKRLLVENPFDSVPTGNAANPERQVFISREMMEKVLAACPNIQWRLIFTLARYGGLRIPSELIGLTWADIQWDQKRFLVRSPKTEHIPGKESRVCPLFPELEAVLTEAFAQAPTGQKNIITMPVNSQSNLRSQAHRIIERAGRVPWEKVFVNLRSSRETELTETFPVHVAAGWLGNSPDIARKHYLQTTEEHFRRAVEWESGKSGLKSGLNTAAPDECRRTQPQRENQAVDITVVCAGSCGTVRNGSQSFNFERIPPRGLEPLLPG